MKDALHADESWKSWKTQQKAKKKFEAYSLDTCFCFLFSSTLIYSRLMYTLTYEGEQNKLDS